MSDTQELSKQQLKSKETKGRIFRAAKTILQEKGYEALSIKNICEEAGVSNGSFYHHFKTKDDLLSYYIEEQPSINPDLLDLPGSAEEAITTIVHVYLNYVEYCKELGLEFISNYYTPKNQSLNPDIRTERPYPILTVHNYLQKSIDAGAIALRRPLEDVSTDIRMIVIGNVFEWCLKNGKADFEQNMRRSLECYLDGKCVLICVSQEFLKKFHVDEAELEGIAGFPLQVEGAEIGITMKEKEAGKFRISMRSADQVNVSAICQRLGGGGHVKAAGCQVEGTADEVRRILLDAVKEEWGKA